LFVKVPVLVTADSPLPEECKQETDCVDLALNSFSLHEDYSLAPGDLDDCIDWSPTATGKNVGFNFFPKRNNCNKKKTLL